MVTLTFQYGLREARLTALVPDGGPETYDLCADHAERTRPPHGWTLHDDRPAEAPGDLPDPDDLRSPDTVAVLAAALRGDDVPSSGPGSMPAATRDDDPAAPDDLAGEVDVDALDAIVAQPIDDVARDGDLFASPDEADPRPRSAPEASSDALTELSALSAEPDTATPDESTPSTPARTVPGARRPD